MNQPSKKSPEGGPSPSQHLPADEHDTRSLRDGATLGDQSLLGPQSLGDEATLGDSHGGLDSELIDDGMEIVELEARYTIESTGGMGEVLLATDTRLNRKAAIKRILRKRKEGRSVFLSPCLTPYNDAASSILRSRPNHLSQ